MDTTQAIIKRRSIRRFKKKHIAPEIVEEILELGAWAPSGLNNQPWKFKVVEGALKDSLAQFTHYSFIVEKADKMILVFLDKHLSYHREKDLMAIGACIQNMLLAIHAKKLGACWLGEILNQKKAIHAFLHIPKTLELVACIALGVPAAYPKKGTRKKLKNLMIR